MSHRSDMTMRDFQNVPMQTHSARIARADESLPSPQVQAVFDPYEFHVAQYQNENASIEHRNASGQWLLDNGFIGCNGKMIVIREVAK